MPSEARLSQDGLVCVQWGDSLVGGGSLTFHPSSVSSAILVFSGRPRIARVLEVIFRKKRREGGRKVCVLQVLTGIRGEKTRTKSGPSFSLPVLFCLLTFSKTVPGSREKAESSPVQGSPVPAGVLQGQGRSGRAGASPGLTALRRAEEKALRQPLAQPRPEQGSGAGALWAQTWPKAPVFLGNGARSDNKGNRPLAPHVFLLRRASGGVLLSGSAWTLPALPAASAAPGGARPSAFPASFPPRVPSGSSRRRAPAPGPGPRRVSPPRGALARRGAGPGRTAAAALVPKPRRSRLRSRAGPRVGLGPCGRCGAGLSARACRAPPASVGGLGRPVLLSLRAGRASRRPLEQRQETARPPRGSRGIPDRLGEI